LASPSIGKEGETNNQKESRLISYPKGSTSLNEEFNKTNLKICEESSKKVPRPKQIIFEI